MKPIMLSFNKQGTFKIVQFTDVHRTFGEAEDQKTMSLMEEVLDKEQPDLVFYTGDMVSGNTINKQGVGDALQMIEEVITPAEKRGIPWTVVFGNHDGEGNVGNEQLLHILQQKAACLTEAGPEHVDGIGNYVLPIYSNDSSEVAALLYGFDSGNKSPWGEWDWIKRSQVNWYVEQSEHLKEKHGKTLPALAFLHIPLPEYNELWDHHVCYGTKWERVCCPDINTGLFAAMVEQGDVIGTFVGHDHANDYYGDLWGIRLMYGRSTGGYTHGNFAHGARIIELKEGARHFNSWIRLADDNIITEQTEHQPNGRSFSEKNESIEGS